MPQYEWNITNEPRSDRILGFMTVLRRTILYRVNELHLIRPNPLKDRHHGMICTKMTPTSLGGLVLEEEGKYDLNDEAARRAFERITDEMGIPQAHGHQEPHPMEKEFTNS